MGSISSFGGFESSAIDSIRHRGPDDTGYYRNGKVALGHSRLAIVDVTANGHQPFVSHDGNYVIVFNGEIYNHQDIRKELLREGYVFHSQSDTETLLLGYIHYGKTILDRLNGIFAFAIYDKVRNEVFIARDQFGVKPLYLFAKDRSLHFSSELKGFKMLNEFDKELDLSALFYYLQMLYAPGEMTPFKYVKRLLPGHYLVYFLSEDRYSTCKYYEPVFNSHRKESENYWIENTDLALVKSVQRQLMSDVPLGFFLSGGLDSSLVVAMACSKMSNSKINCFTAATGSSMRTEGFSDDEKYAKIVAKHLGVNLDVVPADVNIVRDFDQMIWHLDEPQADPAAFNVYNICKMARHHSIKVLLGGAGGDDIFSGYRRHQALSLETSYGAMPHRLKTAFEKLGRSLPTSHPLLRRVKKLSTSVAMDKVSRLGGYYTWLQNDVTMGLFRKDHYDHLLKSVLPEQYLHDKLCSLPMGTDDLNKLLFLEMGMFLPDHNLNYTDKMSMASGVEVRVPFLDLDLVNFVNTMPVKYKMKGTETKYVLKKVGERYLPKNIVYRSKTGFGAPVRTWIKKDMKEMIADRLGGNALREQGIFDQEKISSLVSQNLSNKTDASYTIWSLLSIQSWIEQFA